MYRTHNCGELREQHIGQTVRVCGWLQGVRDIGAVAFAVVRDFYGLTQVAVAGADMLEQLRRISVESTVSVEGEVVKRSSPNPNMPTGMIEIVPSRIEVLGRCVQQLPFEVSTSQSASEDARLKHRYLDLRNPKVKQNIVLRSQIINDLRAGMWAQGFMEIATPILTSSSPEGARDYIVPSRIHAGKFYALPQAPQQYKQLLMCSGFDRYFQIAPCFRDEAARADRSPGEFYQLDLEMAFATQEDVFKVVEEVLPPIFHKYSGFKADKSPFIRIPFREAMEKYGSDKPDLRNPLLISDVSELMRATGFPAFENCVVKAVVVKGFKGTRKQIDEIIADLTAKEYAKNVYWFKTGEGGEVSGGIAKFVAPFRGEVLSQLGLGADCLVMLVADQKLSTAQKEAGRLRTALGVKLELLEKDVYRFCWIVDFPMYEIGEESGELEFCHNPFSMPQGGMDALLNQDPLEILAYQYDIICNGIELSSGAVRNHDPEIMIKAFDPIGTPAEVVAQKFPALFNAFKYGAPPHAGVAPGVDRMVMLICDTPNIREVIPFPMNKSAEDLLMSAPSEVTQKQLDDVHISIKMPKTKE